MENGTLTKIQVVIERGIHRWILDVPIDEEKMLAHPYSGAAVEYGYKEAVSAALDAWMQSDLFPRLRAEREAAEAAPGWRTGP
jgi:hypothetical protein